MDMKVDTQIHQLDCNTKKALEQGGALEMVLTIRTDGTIDIYHPESNPVKETTDPDHLVGKKIKRVKEMAYIQMNSGCVYLSGKCYCW